MAIKILIIDDNYDDRVILEHTLKKEGYEVIIANHGKIGVELAKRNLPNLIICDISMPHMDGWQVEQVLKNEPATAKIPIMMITGTRGIEAVQKSFELGARAYITKPFDIEKVKEKIKHVLIVTQQYQESK